MTPRTTLKAVAAMSLACAFTLPLASAHDDNDHGDRDGGRIVTVAFGNGINTAQPGNPVNHHVLPGVIRVEVGDVVNFVVSGLHVIRIFDQGVRLNDVKRAIPTECLTNPPTGTPFPTSCASVLAPGPVPVLLASADGKSSLGLPLLYSGLNSLAPPPVPPFAPISVDQNRVEAVSFSKPGRFLVICGVLEHFNDGMVAWIEVERDHR
jgi:plastocyanin